MQIEGLEGPGAGFGFEKAFDRWIFYQKQKSPETVKVAGEFFGAANQIRTGDLVLTKDVLYLLSHSSKPKGQVITHPSVATRNGLEPSTSSVTG